MKAQANMKPRTAKAQTENSNWHSSLDQVWNLNASLSTAGDATCQCQLQLKLHQKQRSVDATDWEGHWH